MYTNIDFERLRKDLIDYYGTFMVALFPAASFELSRIENASNEELIVIAKENNFDLVDYQEKGKHLR